MTRTEQLLCKLRTDPAIVTELYPALSKHIYLCFVRSGLAAELEKFEFLTYPSLECLFIPAFTSEKYPDFDQFKKQSNAEVIGIDGKSLFTRMKDLIETDVTELVINPGRNMVFG